MVRRKCGEQHHDKTCALRVPISLLLVSHRDSRSNRNGLVLGNRPRRRVVENDSGGDSKDVEGRISNICGSLRSIPVSPSCITKRYCGFDNYCKVDEHSLCRGSFGTWSISEATRRRSLFPDVDIFLQRYAFNEKIAFAEIFALALIVCGIVMSSLADTSFDWICLGAGLTSGLSVSAKVVLNKRLLNRWRQDRKGEDDSKMVYLCTMFVSSLLVLPVCVAVEGASIRRHLSVDAASSRSEVVLVMLLSGIGLAWMEIASYLLLRIVTPVVHAVCGGLRSLSVVVAGSLYFGTSMPMQKTVGIVLVVAGVLAYSTSKRRRLTTSSHKKK